MSEERLLADARRGDEAAFELLVGRHRRELYAHCYRMFGSRTLWNDLLVAGLVDELHLMLGASVLGGGTPAFAAGPVPPLRLLDSRRRDGSDNLLLRYAVLNRDR